MFKTGLKWFWLLGVHRVRLSDPAVSLDRTIRRKSVLWTRIKPRSSGPHLDAVLEGMCAGAISKARRANQKLQFWNGPQWSVPHVTIRQFVIPYRHQTVNISTCHNHLCLLLIIFLFRAPLLINTFSVNFCLCLYCHLSKYVNTSILINISNYPFIHPHKYVYLSVCILSQSNLI